MTKNSFWTVKVVLLSLQGLFMLFYGGDARAQSSSDRYSARQVSVSYHHAYLDDVLQQLSAQAGVYFVYSAHVLEPRLPAISLTAHRQPLSQVLQALAQQLNLTFRTEGKYIIVKKGSAVKTVTQAPTRPVAPAAAEAEHPAPPATPVAEVPLTLLTSVRSNALYSSLASHQQPARFSPLDDGTAARRPLTWFVSGGVFANDITYGGVEIQGGLKQAFIVLNAGLMEGALYRIGYGAGTSLSLHKRWDLQLTYTFARMRQQDNVKLVGHSWNGAVVRDNSLHIALRHQQVKALLHYRLTSRIDLSFGPTLNILYARYTQRTLTEAKGPHRSFFVSARDTGHPMTAKETASFQPGNNKPQTEYTPSRTAALYAENAFAARQLRLGFEAGVSYRINFLRYR